MTLQSLTDKIKAEALNLGFSACGVARAEAVDAITADDYRQWIASGGHADMAYMTANDDKRLDPRLLVPGVRSIVCVALGYAPQCRLPDTGYQIAAYAYGKDYHDVMKERLHRLAKIVLDMPEVDVLRDDIPAFATNYRIFCDTAPVLERYWAVQAGLGWIGRNHQLIIPRAGSMFFLGELFLDFELAYDYPMPDCCGHCRACIDACPTHALSDGDFRSGRCLSYLTIENHGAIPQEFARCMGDTIYGCDRCQLACPHNRSAQPSTEPLLQPSPDLMAMTRADWHSLTVDDYRRLFKGSAVKRAKYEGLMRNIRAVEEEGNMDASRIVPPMAGE